MELKAALAALLTSSFLLSPRTVQPCSMSGYSRYKHSSPKLITLKRRRLKKFQINSLINKNFLLFTKRQEASQFFFFVNVFIFIDELASQFPEWKIYLYYPHILLASPPGLSLGWSLPAVRTIWGHWTSSRTWSREEGKIINHYGGNILTVSPRKVALY